MKSFIYLIIYLFVSHSYSQQPSIEQINTALSASLKETNYDSVYNALGLKEGERIKVFVNFTIDEEGKVRNMMIENWETCQLFRNCLAKYEGNEAKAIQDVINKYFEDFAKTKDLHFFLGTSALFH